MQKHLTRISEMIKSYKTRQDKTRQDKTRQDKRRGGSYLVISNSQLGGAIWHT